MIVLEFKARVKPSQAAAIDEAIRTSQFVRNKALRYWMDNQGVGKYDLNKLCKQLAEEFPFAKQLNSMARQSAAERAWSSISRFYQNCKKGVRPVGYPKFKKHSRSVEYKTSGWKLLGPKRIKFTDGFGIGELRLIGTYDLARYDESLIKRVRLVRRADGYYVQFCIEAEHQVQIEPSQRAVGIDLGLKYFIAASDGSVVASPQFYRQCEKQLNRANRQKSKKFRRGAKPQSKNYHKARNRYARKHLRVSRQRKE
ncbi:MAG: transposase, partial [Cyanobacteria bacterium Co-bin8]|nr:transposase [Cyanobacteria bacterium Co-bin8]